MDGGFREVIPLLVLSTWKRMRYIHLRLEAQYRSCRRTEQGRPARSRSGLKERAIRFVALMVVPRYDAKTSPVSCQRVPMRSL